MKPEGQQHSEPVDGSGNIVPGLGSCFTGADRVSLATWEVRNKRYRHYAYPIVQTDEGQEYVSLTTGRPRDPGRWQINKEPDGYALVEWPAIQHLGTFATMEEALEAILPTRQAA